MSEAFSKYCNENNINFREIDTEVKAKFWFEAGQRHLPESVEMIIEAATEYEKRMTAIARDDQVELEDLVDSWEMAVIVAARNLDGRQ